VRIQAAVLLARLKDPRALQALGHAATDDAHPTVRVTAIKLLVKQTAGGDAMDAQAARLALLRASQDRDPQVRRAASAALGQMGRSRPSASRAAAAQAPRGATVVAVGHMGDRTGKAPRALRDRMRDEIRTLLAREPRIQVAETAGPGVTYLVDGTIAKLELSTGGPDVQAVCGIELVVSRPPRGIITVASGEAAVQKPKVQFRPQMGPQMQEEALHHAVGSAHENLARFLATAGP
jgi:hypothetical protein